MPLLSFKPFRSLPASKNPEKGMASPKLIELFGVGGGQVRGVPSGTLSRKGGAVGMDEKPILLTLYPRRTRFAV
jgi:hypothetical protein